MNNANIEDEMIRSTGKNQFYREFDFATMHGRKRDDIRTPFQQDRDRIIHSSAFRRLQTKTQVFFSGEYDFYRTRLTHSIEVAQIGRSICNFLKHTSALLDENFYIDPALVEAACLAHDLGHPPFGHAGERTLNRLMKMYGGFEGNAQTLRLLTQILYSDHSVREGMNPTRGLMDGVLKYKTLFSQWKNPQKHFLYDTQKPILEFLRDGKSFPKNLTPGEKLNAFRSIECQIMDWADDTAYSLNDIVDGIRARFITGDRLKEWAARRDLSATEAELYEELLQILGKGNVEKIFARKIGDFIRACDLVRRESFMDGRTSRFRFYLKIDPLVRSASEFYKKVAVDLVFRSPQLHQLEFKWDLILARLFNAIFDNCSSKTVSDLNLLPPTVLRSIKSAADENAMARLICDHIAGMTDGFAIRTYKRLFDPDFGSMGDLI